MSISASDPLDLNSACGLLLALEFLLPDARVDAYQREGVWLVKVVRDAYRPGDIALNAELANRWQVEHFLRERVVGQLEDEMRP